MTTPVQHGGTLDGYKMAADTFIKGGYQEAVSDVVAHDCEDVHKALDVWHASNGSDYGPHYWLGNTLIAEFWAFVEANPDAMADAGITVGFIPDDIRWCTVTHEDGWKLATDQIVELTDDDDFTLVSFNGETVFCNYGEVMVASATYYFSYLQNAIVAGFGTNGVEFPQPGVLYSADIEFACLSIFDPDSDIAQVIEAVPTTQINANPTVRGLTGLDTWLWYDFTNPASWSLGPYQATTFDSAGETWTVTAHAWIDKVMWDIDCQTACDYRGMATGFDTSGYEYELDFEDSTRWPADSYFAGVEAEDQAAFEHIYDARDDYTLSVAAQWRGWYYVTASTGTVAAESLYAPVVVADAINYEVISVRSELRTRP